MAPRPDSLSAPGAATYDSNTLTVGDGTWDFTTNSFLLPNLVGFNFETMRYNGMGNRFAGLVQYHQIVLAHGILAAMVFLFLVPFAVFSMRFRHHPEGYRPHSRANTFAGLLLLAVFILGCLAVGPNRSLTNPHHGIGVAIFVLFILQMVGGRFISHIIKARSFRITVHQWSGRTLALLGIIQVPLGLTLYGSPKYLFVLYTLWMSFLFLLYFILDYRRHGKHSSHGGGGGGRSEAPSDSSDGEGKKKMKWLGLLAAGAGLWALLSRRKKKDNERSSRSRSRSRSYSRSRSRSYSRSHGPDVLPSRRGSNSFYSDEKYHDEGKQKGGGGFMKKLFGAGAALGAAKLVSDAMSRNRPRDEQYSAVSTETPRRHRTRPRRDSYSEYTEYTEPSRRDPRSSVHPTIAAAAISAAQSPMTPRPARAHARTDSRYSIDDTDGYESPSQRRRDDRYGGGGGGIGKGILAGLGMGWLASRFGRKTRDDDMREEEDRRAGRYGAKFTGDGHPSPIRNQQNMGRRPSHPGRGTAASHFTGESDSMIDTRPGPGSRPPMPPNQSPYGPPPPGPQYYPPGAPIPGPPPPGALPMGAPPLGAPPPGPPPPGYPPTGGPPPGQPMPAGPYPPGPPPPPNTMPIPVPMPMPMPGHASRSNSHSRHDIEPVRMPSMPGESQHHESESESYMSPSGYPARTNSSRRRRAGEEAAAAAAASASRLAAEEDAHRRQQYDRARYADTPTRPVQVRMTVHNDPDRKVTLRRLTEDEANMARRERNRADSPSSISGPDSPTNRRYRRDAAQRRPGSASDRRGDAGDPLEPLSPPQPPFAGGRRAKDSAYYSGQPGASGATPPGAPPGAPVSSIGTYDSHGTPSGMSPSPADRVSASAAERRRRRRLERRESNSRPMDSEMFD